MIIISAIFSLVMSCNKMEVTENKLTGNWGLEQTELFENGELKGSTFNQNMTTYYLFEPKGNGESSGTLKIDDEGESEVVPYSFNSENSTLTISNGIQYQIEKITADELVFFKEYDSYKSRYQFQKVD